MSDDELFYGVNNHQIVDDDEYEDRVWSKYLRVE